MSDFDDLLGSAQTESSPGASSPAKPGAENRQEARVRANWPAKVLLPDGRVRDLRIYDLCESGVGFASEFGLPPNQVLNFSIAVPNFSGGRAFKVITCEVKLSHMTFEGPSVHCGGPWIKVSEASRDLMNQWIAHLRK